MAKRPTLYLSARFTRRKWFHVLADEAGQVVGTYSLAGEAIFAAFAQGWNEITIVCDEATFRATLSLANDLQETQ